MLVGLSLTEFAGVLGSDAPAPGGGSVAALSGALGAELVSMVCRLSIGRQDLEPHKAELLATLESAQTLSKRLLTSVDLDTEAFNHVMAAFKLPKQTDEEKKTRSAQIQASYREAAQSPLAIARDCLGVLSQTQRIIGKSNPNALSDLGVASQQAYAGLEGASMNVKINLPAIKDGAFKTETMTEVETLLAEGRKARDDVYKYLSANLG